MLTHGAAFDVLSYKLRETQPPKFGSYELAGLEITGMTGSLMIMVASKDGVMEGILWGNILYM